MHWCLIPKLTSNNGGGYKHLSKVVPSSSPPVSVAVGQAMKCRHWTRPCIACMKGIMPPASVHHWMEVSTLAHHVNTKSILELLISVQTGKSINQGVIWQINHARNFFVW